MFDVGAIAGRLELGLEGWKKSVEAVKDDQVDMGKAAGTHSEALKSLWAQFAIGFTAAALLNKAAGFIKDTFRDSIKEAADYEKAVTGLNAAFSISGRTMPGMTQHLKDYADELMAAGLADDTLILKVESLLLQLTNLDEKGIKAATRGAIGLSSVFGMDLTSAAEAVAKGMEGNYIALGRLIPAIKSATSESEKQTAMMKAFEDLYARAIADTDTYAGRVKKLGLEWGDTKKAFGEAILSTGILQAAVGEATNILRDFTEATKSHVGQAEKEIEIQNKRYEALKEVAKGMGLSSVALANLIMQHDGYTKGVGQGNLATYQWIKAGGLGTAAQKLLTIALEEQNKKLADSKKGFNETGTAIANHTNKIKELSVEIKETLLPVDRLTLAGKALRLGLYDVGIQCASLGVTLTNTSIPAVRDTAKAWEELGPKIKIPDESKENLDNDITEISSKWADLMRDITQGWADGFKQMAEGTLSFKDFLADTWDSIKTVFFRVIADMVTEWLTKFVVSLLQGGADAATGVTGSMDKIGTSVGNMAKSVISAIGDIVKTILDVIETIAKTVVDIVTYALRELAYAIRDAIEALAAAAPELLELGIVAAAIYGAFKFAALQVDIIKQLFGIAGSTGGAGFEANIGKIKIATEGLLNVLMTDIRDNQLNEIIYWLGQIAQFGGLINDGFANLGRITTDICVKIDNLASILNGGISGLLGDIKTGIGDVVTAIQGINFGNLTGRIGDVITAINGIGGSGINRIVDGLDWIWRRIGDVVDAIAGISGAQFGHISTRPELVMVHGSPSVPEITFPINQMPSFMGSTGGGSFSVNFNGPLVQSEGVSESDLERAGERLFSIIEREAKRRAMRFAHA